MSSLEQIATSIVRGSICTAICVDDQFIEPFKDYQHGEKTQPEKTKELYESFKENNCMLNIYRYNEHEEKPDINLLLANKDLLILDWELTETEPKFRASLDILSEAVYKEGLHFVCIYTQVPNIELEVIPYIFAYFSGLNLEQVTNDYDKLCEEIEEKFDDIDAAVFLEELLQECGYIIFDEDMEEDITKKIDELLKSKKVQETKEFFNVIRRVFRTGKMQAFLRRIYFQVKNACTFSQKERTNVFLVDKDKKALFINNTLVVVTPKTIEPNELYSNLASTISMRPGNIFSLLGLEMRTRFRNCALAVGKDINNIDENAFLYFYMQTKKDKEIFQEHMKSIWKDEIASTFLTGDPRLFTILDEFIDESKVEQFRSKENFNCELTKLNAYFSSVRIKRENKSIRFGDIFEKKEGNGWGAGNQYLLCITPHCDCVLPEKIHNNFYFVRGVKVNTEEDLKEALRNAETGYYSFVERDKKIICIKWICKILTLHIEDKENNIDTIINSFYQSEKIQLKHIGLQKENYTQRVANEAASHVARVGITYLKIEEDCQGLA